MPTIPKKVTERIVVGVKRFQPILSAAKARDWANPTPSRSSKTCSGRCSATTNIQK